MKCNMNETLKRHTLLVRKQIIRCTDRQNQSNSCWDSNFSFFFSRWQPSATLDLCGAFLDDPQRALGCLYHRTIFGLNRCSSFDSMKVLMFVCLSWKCLFTYPKKWFLGNFTPKMGRNMNATWKSHILARKHVIWRIDYQNWLNGC